jgi:hypothetical protein
MTITKTLLRSTFAALCLAACNGSLGDMTDTSDDTNQTGNASNDSGDLAPCSSANPCPSGQFCFNGICAIGCTNNGDCAEDQYCATDTDMLCHNKEVTTCPETPCADGQVCVQGLCSTPPSTGCDLFAPQDGCESNELCIPVSEEEGKCYSFPACGEGDTCPIGTEGAVCNVDLIREKDKICLPGMCTDDKHCPAEWKCVKLEAKGVVGACSNGSFGDPCWENTDCNSGSCFLPFPGESGTCM